MIHIRILLIGLVFCASTLPAFAQPCNYTMEFDVNLSAGQTASQTATLSGDLISATFNLEFTGGGASYPGDMMAYIYAPNGECVVWGGWNINPTGGCQDLGTGGGGFWPGSWNTTQNGFHTANINFAAYNLEGAGDWTVVIQNAWTPSGVVNYDMDIIFNGICEGDCFVQNACNFNPNAELINNDLCIYAIDLYPNGLYDCDGNCYVDTDGDGVCNALEIPGCTEEWACNYNPLATDPPPPLLPCTYPEDNDVDCDGNSLLPQFQTFPQNTTVSCANIPEPAVVSAIPAQAAIEYEALYPESCFDLQAEVYMTFEENEYPGSCPGNKTIERIWHIADCAGHENTWIQTLNVVDNIPPYVESDLSPVMISCNDPVTFDPIQAVDACGGNVFAVGEPTYVTIPGICEGEFTKKKTTVISDQCGNTLEVEQVLVMEDNEPPSWLDEPQEVIITDDIYGGDFDEPVADDACSEVDVTMTLSYEDGLCPLSVILTRTFIAIDECQNVSAPFVQTITEATDLSASLETTQVSCHDGNDGTAVVTATGGVAPYSLDWNGYDPSSLSAGEYLVAVLDANQCNVVLPFSIFEPGTFGLDLTPIQPNCDDPLSGGIVAEINGGSGDVELDWGGINPEAVSPGTYTIVATDEAGCLAEATVEVPSAEVPETLELTGDAYVVQGDSAAYYYEYTLGSTYEWTFTGAIEEQVLTIFAISLLWDGLEWQEVCVIETNQEGCTGEPVCMDVYVEDDVWNVEETVHSKLTIFPNPAADFITIQIGIEDHGKEYQLFNSTGAVVAEGILREGLCQIDVRDLSDGQYVLQIERGSAFALQVMH